MNGEEIRKENSSKINSNVIRGKMNALEEIQCTVEEIIEKAYKE
jgi:hypothetical protein